MNKRTCTMPECNRAHRARGLCGSHYNQEHAPNRHAKKLVACAWCGKEVLKNSGGSKSRQPVCSYECRQWLTTPYCVIPKDHWARVYGKSSAWYPPKPPAFIPENRSCMWCGTAFIATRTDRRACTRRCKVKASAARRRALEHSAPGTYTWAEVMRVWIGIDKCCSYCNELTTEIEPDHVIPLSKGGSNSITNVTPSCKLCNSDKRDLLLHEWYIDRARRGLPPRQLNTRLHHLTHALLVAA